ncbi:hypothetical protein [Litorisediminicola beolgyonensis]|uniref:hypothetical protein n=1 Tax=Litorisediminicola beolgyonensis TaxID=1173614 RepID=UPI0036DD3321
MTLTFLMLCRNDVANLTGALQRLATAIRPGDRVLLADFGSEDGTLARLESFAARESAQCDVSLIRLDAAAPRQPAALLRAEGAGFGLWFTPEERVVPQGVAELRQSLAGDAPDLVVAALSFSLGHGLATVAAPDTVESVTTAASMQALTPNPARLVHACDAAWLKDWSEGGFDTLWSNWDTILATARHAVYVATPLLAPPLPSCTAPEALFYTARHLTDEVVPAEALISRCDAALCWADPRRIEALCAAARALLDVAPDAANGQGPTSELLRIIQAGSPADTRAFLAWHASCRGRAISDALATGLAKQQLHLEAALPGPDYFDELYARLWNG